MVLWALVVLLALVVACGIACAVVLRLTMGRYYPTFLPAKHWPEGTAVPVILYHAVEPAHFSRELRYLRANGYESISANTLVAWLNGEDVSLPERPIVLTFDDGHESLWSVAYPLLGESAYQAIAFICPWWLEHPPHLRHVSSSVDIREYCHPVTWEQLREMDASGVVDVQSHTFDHSRVWADSAVVDFMKPKQWLPFVCWDDQAAPGGVPIPPLGWPILPHCQRFSHCRRFFPDPEPMRACADHVAAHGGAAFFRRDNWADELRKLLPRQSPECRIPGQWETPDEQEHALRDDLLKSKRLLEERLDKPVQHMAFPKYEASTLATSLASEVGYRSAFRGVVVDRDICQLGDDPMCIPRAWSGGLARYYVLSLPGRRRRPPERVFAAIAVDRLRRRLRAR